MVWPSLNSLSATILGRPGMCRALESLVSWYSRSRFSIVGPTVGLIPPSFMYDTTVVLSVATSTILLSKGLGTLLKPERLL